MSFEEFIENVRKSISEILGEGVDVKLRKVLKNNNIEMDALTILEKEKNISPTIYLEGFYNEYKKGKDFGDLVNDIYQLYEEQRSSMNFNVDEFMNFDKMKDKIMYKLVNTKANEKLLDDVPNIPFLDLSIVFYCLINNAYIGSATTLIHNVHMEMWNKNIHDLFVLARENTPKIMEYELKNMTDLLRDILMVDIRKNICESEGCYDENCSEEKVEEVADDLMETINKARDQIAMYVLSNKQRMNGAICILYDDVIKEFADEVGSNIYILPSSVHEVILVPDDNIVKEDDLSNMVNDVNRHELAETDILSEHTYYYNREMDKILVSKYDVPEI